MRQVNHSSDSSGAWPAITAKLRSTHRFFTLALLLSAVALIGTAAGLRGARAQSGDDQGPDYSNVNDFLNGGTHLLRDDDLVMTMVSVDPDDPSSQLSALSSISTSNSSGTFYFENPPDPGCFLPACNQGATVYGSPVSITGRFFRTLQDSVVRLTHTVDYPDAYYLDTVTGIATTDIHNQPVLSYSQTSHQLLPTFFNSEKPTFLPVTADFNGDGYDDVLIAYSDPLRYVDGNARVMIATAANLDDPSRGFNFSQETQLGFSDAIRAVTTGDFNGDGYPEIAVLRVDVSKNLVLAIFAVDPKTFAVSYVAQTTVETMPDYSTVPMQLAAGKFTAEPHQQIIVSNPSGPNQWQKLRIFDFDQGSYQPVVKQTWDTTSYVTYLKLRVGRLSWSSPYDQIVLMLTNYNPDSIFTGTSLVRVVTVDPATYEFSVPQTLNVPDTVGFGLNTYVALDIAIGNFDNYKGSKADPSVLVRNPNLQLAVAVATANGDDTRYFKADRVYIFDTDDPSKLTLAGSSHYSAKEPAALNLQFNSLSIEAGDLRGRSLRLGSYYKISVDKASPTLILAQPPLHVDWAPLDLSNSNPTVVNLSFANDRFNATFTTTDSTNNTSSYSKTNGWGFSQKQSLGASLTFGRTDVAGNLQDGLKIDETFTAQQSLEQSTETTNGTSVTTAQTIAQTTGSNDVVWYQDGITYLYAYEVIGQTICPADKPNCQESERAPLTVMMSAPGPTTTQYVSAEALEWYQPVWENGNVLSYPANNNQLLKSMDSQTTAFGSATQRTDTTTTSFTTTWAGTQSQGQDVSSSQMFEEDSDTNVEAAGGMKIFSTGFAVDANLNLDFGGSDSLSTLRTTSSTIESARGMTINKNVNFHDSNTYGYDFSGVIFGKKLPLGYFDGTDPNTPGSGLPPGKPGLNIFGPMRSAFTVDPLANSQGGWWSHSYSAAPDVALNHPNRWSQAKLGVSAPVPANCVGTNDGYMDCVAQKTRQPFDPWDDSFHSMRGFFVFKAGEANPNEPFNQGLQQQLATAGDQLSLQARVYNYSLKEMPAGTQVKVRFYGMPWNTQTMLPPDYQDVDHPGGASFLIGETTLDPITPWNKDTDTPNYSIASVNFDTTGHDNQDLVFWVAVWMQDANGQMVAELPGKGLTALPADSTTPTFLDLIALEPTTANLWKENDDDPDTTSFSNNIGFYKQPFYIQEKGAQATQASAGDFTPGIRQSVNAVSVKNLDLTEPSIRLGQSSEVYATLHNGAENLAGLSVHFYDGDPAKGGRLFDVDRLAYIRAGADHKVRARFTPRECGMHQVFVKVFKSGMGGATGSVETQLRVTCTIPDSRDHTPPQLEVTLSPNTLWPANGRMVPVTAHVTVSDDQDPRPDVRLEAITHNGGSDASGDVEGAAFGTDDRQFALRAARDGRFNLRERVYEVVYSATDWAGNKTYAKAYVTVPRRR